MIAAWLLSPTCLPQSRNGVISWEHLSTQGQAEWRKLGMDETYVVVPARSRHYEIPNDQVPEEHFVSVEKQNLVEHAASAESYVLDKGNTLPNFFSNSAENYISDKNEVFQNVFDDLSADAAWEQVGFGVVVRDDRVISTCPQNIQEKTTHRIWRGSSKPGADYLQSRRFKDVMWATVYDEEENVKFSGNNLSCSWLVLDTFGWPVYQTHIWTYDDYSPPGVFRTPMRGPGKWFRLDENGTVDPSGLCGLWWQAPKERQKLSWWKNFWKDCLCRAVFP